MKDELQKTLDVIKEKTGRETYSDVIRDAIKAYVWIISEYERGHEVLSRPFEKNTTPFSPLTPQPKNK